MNIHCDQLSEADTVLPHKEPTGDGKRWRHTTLSRGVEMAPVLEDVLALLEGLGYSVRDRMHVRLALEEAIVNGLHHGNRNDPRKFVRVRYRADHASALFEVEDDGCGFEPDRVPDPTLPENLDRPNGRGLLLMRHCMTWVRVCGRGNRVVLCKARSG